MITFNSTISYYRDLYYTIRIGIIIIFHVHKINTVTLPMAETTTPIPLTTTTEHIQSTTERQATTRSKPTTKYQITTTSQPTTEPTTEPTTKSPSTSAMTTAATDPLAMVSTDEIIMSVSTSSESTTDHDSKTSSDIQGKLFTRSVCIAPSEPCVSSPLDFSVLSLQSECLLT